MVEVARCGATDSPDITTEEKEGERTKNKEQRTKNKEQERRRRKKDSVHENHHGERNFFFFFQCLFFQPQDDEEITDSHEGSCEVPWSWVNQQVLINEIQIKSLIRIKFSDSKFQ